MAIAFVKTLGSANSKSSATTIQIASLPAAGVAAGDTVVVAVTGSTASIALSSVTDSKGNTYTILTDRAGTTSRLSIAASVISTALTTLDTITATFASAQGIRVIVANEFSGLGVTQDVTAVAAAGTSASPSVGPSATTTQAATLTFAAFSVSNATASGTFTQGSGYTKDQEATTGTTSTNRSLATEHRINAATGTQTANGTYATSMAWDGVEVVLQAAGGTTTISASDSATLTDAVGGMALSAADSATAAEATGPTAFSTTDAATLAEAPGPVALSAADSGTIVEAIGPITLSSGDSSALTEATAVTQLANISATDAFSITEQTQVTDVTPPPPPPPMPTGGSGGDGRYRYWWLREPRRPEWREVSLEIEERKKDLLRRRRLPEHRPSEHKSLPPLGPIVLRIPRPPVRPTPVVLDTFPREWVDEAEELLLLGVL